jgi:signal transduction histidine kinase
VSDINLVKVMAEQLGVTLKRLEIVKAVRDTEKSNQEMSVLSSVGKAAMNISHELASALAPVQFSAAILVNLLRRHVPKSDPQRTKILARAEESARTITEKINSASDITQSMKNTFTLARMHRPAPEVVSVNLLLDQIASKYRRARGTKVVISVSPRLGAIRVSPASLISVFDYLISNAKEAMKNRGTVTITAIAKSDEVIISVTDEGPGIKPSHLEVIFGLGYTTKKGQGKGTGFGLWHAREIVEDYDGQLLATSKRGEGATFVIRLPRVNEKGTLKT